MVFKSIYLCVKKKALITKITTSPDVPTTSDNKNNSLYNEISTNNSNGINPDSIDEKISNFLNEKSGKII